MSSFAQTLYDFSFTTLDGQTVPFSEFRGKKVLIVNTASRCGYTPQYADLQELHEKYKDKVVIVGFPANNFGAQEPGTNDQIKEFCQKNYGVTFYMSQKVSVKGDDMAPLFRWLTTQPNPDFTGDIKWNFEKFLLDENGRLIRRFRSGVNPLDKDILNSL
ncbi:MAG: glutathione peroxidase [Flavobacteriales bacterium]|nr:glutathione peroxidase [Flavobacteriales bacterium]MDW8410556.1 glutathione peroxidase [Flavobacteriales bacterium]